MERAAKRGIAPQTKAFKKWGEMHRVDPRGIPPSIVKAEIMRPGTTGVHIILSERGDVVTVWIQEGPGEK